GGSAEAEALGSAGELSGRVGEADMPEVYVAHPGRIRAGFDGLRVEDLRYHRRPDGRKRPVILLRRLW
ncbi:MAG: hypothetical protein ACO3NL_05795, partial [Phycisphaerales bacterium]